MPEWGKAYPYLELGYCPCLKTFETQPSNAAPHSQADRTWREAESVITMSRTSDGTMRRVRIGNELLISLQSSRIKLWRDNFCKSVLGLPPLDFLFGSAFGSEQLHLHVSVSDSVVSTSVWGVGGAAGVMVRNETWREAAVRVVTFNYDGDGDHNLTTLLPDVSPGNVRLLLGLRVGRTWTTLPNRFRSGPKLPNQVISDRTEVYLAKWSKSFDLSVPTKS